MGWLFVLISAMAFGSMAIMTKFAYAAGANVTSVLFFRFLLAAAVLWCIVLFKRLPIKTKGSLLLSLFLLGAVGYSAQSYLFFLTIEVMSAAVAAILLYTYPAIVFLLALLLKQERFTLAKLASLLLTVSGALLVIGVSMQATALNPLGILTGLGAAGVFSFYLLLSGKVAPNINSLVMTTYICSFAALSLGVNATISGQLMFDLPAQAYISIVGIALISTVLAIVALNIGLSLISPAKASILSTVEPVFTVLLSYLFFGETMSYVQILGGMMILVGVIILQLKAKEESIHAVNSSGESTNLAT